MRQDLARLLTRLDHREHPVERVVVELLAALQQGDQFLEQFGDRRDRRRVVAADPHLVAAHADLRGRELLLDASQHVVSRTEERRGEVSAGNDDGRGRR